jgi:hypothetical protein
MSSSDEWKRTSGAGGQSIAGKWQRSATYGPLTWEITLDIDAAGPYRFVGQLKDGGTFTMKDGRWKQVSGAGGILSGQYEVLGKDAIVFKNEGPVMPQTAQVTWRRPPAR